MDDVDRFYLAVVQAYAEHAKTSKERVKVYVSEAFHRRLSPDLGKHPAAGFLDKATANGTPDKIAGLPIVIAAEQADEFVVRP